MATIIIINNNNILQKSAFQLMTEKGREDPTGSAAGDAAKAVTAHAVAAFVDHEAANYAAAAVLAFLDEQGANCLLSKPK